MPYTGAERLQKTIDRSARRLARNQARAIIASHRARYGRQAGKYWEQVAWAFQDALEEVYNDYLRRHHDAVDWFEELLVLRTELETLRNGHNDHTQNGRAIARNGSSDAEGTGGSEV